MSTLPTKRSITSGEKSLLRPVFEITIPLEGMEVAANLANLGGANNSITPFGVPEFSTQIWCADFSDANVSDACRGTFVHEFMHVWQYYHGIRETVFGTPTDYPASGPLRLGVPVRFVRLERLA